MHDIQLLSRGAIRFTVGETQYFFIFPNSDTRVAGTEFSGCVALLAELRKTDSFTISFQMRTDIPEAKTISFTDLTISVHSLVEPARPIIAPPRVP